MNGMNEWALFQINQSINHGRQNRKTTTNSESTRASNNSKSGSTSARGWVKMKCFYMGGGGGAEHAWYIGNYILYCVYNKWRIK